MMASSANASSLARSRSLRSNGIKPPSSLNPQPTITAPVRSNITLFLTNLRLLELDLRDDWPETTAVIFSSSMRLENQKKRIQFVEWALYNLFALWDPEETRNKLQPFFPPLEPLQSLNLRAALFRSLDQAKKNGVLGRDTVLRKTMLDECKGDRLEEVLAVFSKTVLKKVIQEKGSEHYESIAQKLAYENFSYTDERSVLSALILAHKASLSKHFLDKQSSREKYRDFSNLLDLNDRRILRRQEQLKEVVKERSLRERLSNRETVALQEQVQRNWSGSDEWLETILYGDSRFHQDGLLATPFERLWRCVEDSSIGDVEGKQSTGLLERLDARVRDQENRLARWQDFSRTLSKAGSGSPSKKSNPEPEQTKIDLGFSHHEELQIGRRTSNVVRNTSAVSMYEYAHLIENMRTELAEVGKPQVRQSSPSRQISRLEKPLSTATSPSSPKPESLLGQDEEWSSANDTDETSPGFNDCAKKSTSQTPPSEVLLSEPQSKDVVSELPSEARSNIFSEETARTNRDIVSPPKPASLQKDRAPTPKRQVCTPPPTEAPKAQDSESQLADQILNSMSAASPSPKKQRHTLSLAERTRLSMSRASHSEYSDLHDGCDNLADLPQLSIRPKPGRYISSSASSEEEKHANLIERTRKSMAGFEAAQRKAQIERRRSIKNAKKRQRESSYFPKLEEEDAVTTPGIDTQGLMDGDPDYESVFMSRPKIKTSPAVSPTRVFGDGDGLSD